MGLIEFLKNVSSKEQQAQGDAPEVRKPRVLIGVAGFHGVCPEVQENFFEFAYNCGRRMPEYDFFLKVLIKREQYRARNNLVDLALINGCDWLLMLDDDMVIPPDLLIKMMAHDKPVCGALYYQRGGAHHPVLMRQYSKKDGMKAIDFIRHHDDIIRNPGLHRFEGVIGGGCMLFKTEVFHKIPQPYFWIDGIVGTDVHVCAQLLQAGVEIWVDTSIELGHLGDMQIITSRTVPQYSKKIGLANERLWNDLKAFYMHTDDELEKLVVEHAFGVTHKARWDGKPRDTWEGVREYYTSDPVHSVLNLAYYNLRYDQARDWAINDMGKVAKQGSRIVDFGAGIGYTTIESALQGYKMVAMDLKDTGAWKFLEHRVAEHKVDVEMRGFSTPVPEDLDTPADGVLMISVLDHLWDPWGTLQWINRNVKSRGFLLCDTFQILKKPDEPQHLCKYDPHKIVKQFLKLGWKSVPENPFLFIKE